MGREASCLCRLGSESGMVKALLESRELILRGGFKRVYALTDLRGVEVVADTLRFRAGAEAVELELGAAEAGHWARKIAAPPRPLAAKLGLSTDNKAFVMGVADDEPLKTALSGVCTPLPAAAGVMVAIVRSGHELAAARSAHERLQHNPPLWIVHPKGRGASLGDSEVRQVMRGAGYVDNKVSAVSDALTAVRYIRKVPGAMA